MAWRLGSGWKVISAPGNASRVRWRRLARAGVEAGHVVGVRGQLLARGRLQPGQRLDGVGHGHEGDARVLAHEAGVGLALGRVVQHLGRVVAGAAGGQREGADQAREADAAEVDVRAVGRGGELAVVLRVVAAQVLAVQLVAAVHRGGHVPLVLLHRARPLLGRQVGQAVGGDRAGEHEGHRLPQPSRLLGGQAQQGQRALHVDAVRGLGGVLRARREQRGQVVHERDGELR